MQPNKPIVDVRTLLPLAQQIYDRSCVGCCLHIVLDDDNIEDHHVQWCLEHAEHDDCRELAQQLVLCSRTQRLKLGELVIR